MTDTIKTSRRALLAGVPVAAALAAGTTVSGLAAGLAPSSTDPIFAVIAEYVDATKAYVASCHISMCLPDGTEDWKTADAVTAALMERWHAAWLAVVTAQPTTVHGAAALLAQVGRSEFLGEEEKRSGHPETETVLSSGSMAPIPSTSAQLRRGRSRAAWARRSATSSSGGRRRGWKPAIAYSWAFASSRCPEQHH
jgi:hypothetical protein